MRISLRLWCIFTIALVLGLSQPGCGGKDGDDGTKDGIGTVDGAAGDSTAGDGTDLGTEDAGETINPTDTVTPDSVADMPGDGTPADLNSEDQSGSDQIQQDVPQEIVIPQECGNKIPEGNEQCDDQNSNNLDGCLENCKLFDPCGKVTGMAPQVSCTGNLGDVKTLTFTGEFIKLDGTDPVVTFDGNAATNVVFSDCAVPTELFKDLTVTPNVQICTTMTLDLPVLADTVSDHPITITTQGLSTTCDVQRTFSIGDKPTLTSVDPITPCSAGKKFFEIRGTNLVAGTQVIFKTGSTEFKPNSQKLTTTDTLRVTFDSIPPGIYQVLLSNGPGCEAPSNTNPPEAVVANVPTILFVDPPVTYKEISIQATVFLSGLVVRPEEANKVVVRIKKEPDGSSIKLAITFDPNNPNQIQVVLPKLEPGTYRLDVLDPSECTGSLPGAFTVSDTIMPTLITGVDPEFGQNTKTNAVTLEGSGFQNGARVYLNPTADDSLGAGWSRWASPTRRACRRWYHQASKRAITTLWSSIPTARLEPSVANWTTVWPRT